MSPQTTPSAPALTPVRAWTIAVVATLAMSVSYLDRQALAVLAVTVRQELGIDHAHFGLLLGAFSMAYLIGAPLAGTLVDRVGARGGMAGAVLAWSVVAAAHAFVPGFATLFVLRIALGLAEAPSFPGAAQAVRRALPPRHRSAGFGMIFTGSSVGAMLAPAIAIGMKVRFGWRFAFVGVALVGLAWVPMWLAATSGGVIERRADEPSPETEGSLATALGTMVRLVARPELLRGLVLVVVSAPALMLIILWFPQYLVSDQGIRPDDIARYAWLPPFMFDIGAIGFGALASRSGAVRRSHMLVSCALATALALVPLARGAVLWATILCGVSMAGGAGLYALLTADALARVGVGETSRAGGLCAAAQSLAYIVANPVIGRVLDRTHRYDEVLVVLGLLGVPGTLLWVAWPGIRARPA